jgi:hypothetical protein
VKPLAPIDPLAVLAFSASATSFSFPARGVSQDGHLMHFGSLNNWQTWHFHLFAWSLNVSPHPISFGAGRFSPHLVQEFNSTLVLLLHLSHAHVSWMGWAVSIAFLVLLLPAEVSVVDIYLGSSLNALSLVFPRLNRELEANRGVLVAHGDPSGLASLGWQKTKLSVPKTSFG